MLVQASQSLTTSNKDITTQYRKLFINEAAVDVGVASYSSKFRIWRCARLYLVAVQVHLNLHLAVNCSLSEMSATIHTSQLHLLARYQGQTWSMRFCIVFIPVLSVPQ